MDNSNNWKLCHNVGNPDTDRSSGRGLHPRLAYLNVDLTAYKSGFSLRRVVSRPERPPIDIMLAFGPPLLTLPVCQRFATGANFFHLNVQELLLCIQAEQDEARRREALGLLDPFSLNDILSKGRCVDSILLMPILLRHIDEKVATGARKFIITGLQEEEEVVVRFMENIADLRAVIFFGGEVGGQETFRSRTMTHFAQTGRALEVKIDAAHGVDETFEALLDEIGKKVLAHPVALQAIAAAGGNATAEGEADVTPPAVGNPSNALPETADGGDEDAEVLDVPHWTCLVPKMPRRSVTPLTRMMKSPNGMFTELGEVFPRQR